MHLSPSDEVLPTSYSLFLSVNHAYAQRGTYNKWILKVKGLGISPFYGDVYRSPLYAVLLDRQSTIALMRRMDSHIRVNYSTYVID